LLNGNKCGIHIPSEIIEQFSDDKEQNERAAIIFALNKSKIFKTWV
jgi:5,10-methylenetetrahydrofolate reductase